jgi:calcium/calmodulin-dependent protein kinase I
LALQYLHSKGIVHGDVKLENVLLSEAGNLNSVKLSDFGMSRLCEPQYSPVNAGTPQYMAPEVLQVGSDGYCKQARVRTYLNLCLMQGEVGACLSPCDVWSAGVCAYVLLVGDFPFKGNSNEEILQSIYNGSHHSHMECLYPGTRAFINRLLCVDISQRLTALEALKEPWVCGRQLSALSPSQFSIRLSQSMNRSLSE